MGQRWAAIQVVLCVAMAAAGGEAAFEVGQRWVYQHSGPKPGGLEPEPIDGQRIAQVLRHDPNDDLWIIEERYTNSSDPASRLHVDPKRTIVAIEIDSKDGPPARLRYDPPVPYEAPELAVGQTATIETTLHMDSPVFSMPIRLEIERLADETIATDAGVFEACRHYRTTSRTTLDIKIGKIPLTEQRHRWYHRQAGGLVKETYHKDPTRFLTWSRDGYDASSTLTAFGVEAVSESALSAMTFDPNAARDLHAAPASGARSPRAGPVAVVLASLAVIAAVGGLLVARRRSMKPPHEASNDNS